MELKECSVCGNKLPESMFHKHLNGTRSNCKVCHNSYNKQWKKNNAERVRFYRQKRRDRHAVLVKQWSLANKDRVNVSARKYRATHKTERRILQIKRRSKISQSNGYCTDGKIIDRIKFYGNKCWICGGPYESLDHVKPLIRGGNNLPSNLRPACLKCNSSKGCKWPINTKPTFERVYGSKITPSIRRKNRQDISQVCK